MKLTIAGTLSDNSIINGLPNDFLVFANSSEFPSSVNILFMVSVIDLLKPLLQSERIRCLTELDKCFSP